MNDIDAYLRSAYVMDNYDAFKDMYNKLNTSMNDKEIQTVLYDIGNNRFDSTKEWFQVLYGYFLNRDHGPRLGQLIRFLGIDYVKEMVKSSIDTVDRYNKRFALVNPLATNQLKG